MKRFTAEVIRSLAVAGLKYFATLYLVMRQFKSVAFSCLFTWGAGGGEHICTWVQDKLLALRRSKLRKFHKTRQDEMVSTHKVCSPGGRNALGLWLPGMPRCCLLFEC